VVGYKGGLEKKNEGRNRERDREEKNEIDSLDDAVGSLDADASDPEALGMMPIRWVARGRESRQPKIPLR
jgi:hypothetical protein